MSKQTAAAGGPGKEPTVGMATGNTFAGERAEISLGIDPGLNRTGYALLKRNGARPILIEGGVIRSTPSGTLAERVHEIGQGIRELLEEFKPGGIAIEKIFSLPKNPKTAILMAHARGAILFTVADFGRPLVHYTPRQVKKLLTGSGSASKEQVQRAIQRELRLEKILAPNDVADACAVALCHYHSARTDLSAAAS